MIATIVATSASGSASNPECPASSLRIHIVDEAVRPDSEVYQIDQIADPHFRAFVTTVTEHALARLAEAEACADSASGSKRSRLRFVRLPLVTSGDEPLVAAPSLEARPSDSCRISSPWIDLAIERTPALRIRGVVRWSERQLLFDQAVLTGAQNLPDTPSEPLTRSDYERLTQDYADSEILGQPPAASQPIEDQIPPDVLWLYRHAWQSTRGPFSGTASGAMSAALERGAEGYTKIVLALIDRCFVSSESSHRYDSILDLANIISLEEYRIDQLY